MTRGARHGQPGVALLARLPPPQLRPRPLVECFVRRWPLLLTLVTIGAAPTTTAGAVTTVRYSERVDSVSDRGMESRSALLVVEGDDGPSSLLGTREGGDIVFRDPLGVRPGPGCGEVPGEAGVSVRCPTTILFTYGRVQAAGGDDRLTLVGLGELAVDAGSGDDAVIASGQLGGGPGTDELRGSEQDDLLDGGPGRDLLDGRGGRDLADYRLRTDPVRVDLGAGTVRSTEGERDRLTQMEGALGGAGDDVLTGTDGPDRFEGGPGDDILIGGAGRDVLGDSEGGGRLLGGRGPDVLHTQRSFTAITTPGPVGGGRLPRRPPGRARLVGGSGDDRFLSGTGRDTIIGGAGVDVVMDVGTGDRVLLRDGRAERVECPSPRRRPGALNVDADDLTQGCGRVDRRGAARPRLVTVGSDLFEENRGTSGTAVIACSDDQRPACRGTIRLSVEGRSAGRRRFAVRAGTTQAVTFPLARFVAARVRDRGTATGRYRIATSDARGRSVTLSARQRFCESPSDPACDAETRVDPTA